MIQREREKRVHAMETQGFPYSQEISYATISWKDHGTQKVFCFWNSRHTRQTLLETPVLPHWWLYARILNRNALESCRLVHWSWQCTRSYTSHAHRGLLWANVASTITIRPTVLTWLPVTNFSSKILRKVLRGRRFSDDSVVKEDVTGYLWHPRCLIFSEGIRSLVAKWTKGHILNIMANWV